MSTHQPPRFNQNNSLVPDASRRRTSGVTLFCLATAALATAALAMGCGGSSSTSTASTPAGSDKCQNADIDAKRVWNEQTRVEVKGQVMQWGGEVGVDVARSKAEEITSTMDRLSDDWARMRKAVCMDHFVRETLDAEGYQRRVDCMDRLLTRQRTFLTSLSSPQADVSASLAAIDEELMSCR